MNIRLGRTPWAIGWLVWASSFAAASPPSADELAYLTQQLSAPDFAARESAVRQLTSATEWAIPALAVSICGADPESAWRAVSALQHMAITADPAGFAKISVALRRENEKYDRKLTQLIADLRARRAAHRRQAAHEQIRSFGGRFGGGEADSPIAIASQTDITLPAPPPDLPPDGQQLPESPVQTPVLIADAYVSPLLSRDVVNPTSNESLTIDQNWRGGDAGLAPLCDLPELSSLSLSRAPLTDAALDTIAQIPAIQSLEIEDMTFSAAALAKFRTRQPRARVVARGANMSYAP